MFHGEKTIPGPRPTEQSRGTEVVADTAGRQYFSRGKHRQETFSDTTGRQKVQLSHATQNFMQEKNRQAGKNKIPHQKNRNEISGDTSPRQNFIQEKSRKEILVDPSGRQNFPHGKNRKEITIVILSVRPENVRKMPFMHGYSYYYLTIKLQTSTWLACNFLVVFVCSDERNTPISLGRDLIFVGNWA